MAEPKNEDPFARIAELSRRAVARTATATDEALSLQLFLARLDAELSSPLRRWARWRWLLPIPASLGIVATLLLFWRRPPVTFTVEGGERSGRYVSTSEQAPAELRFSDASHLVVAPGSRVRIEGATSRGALVLLERGRVSTRVMQTSKGDWTFAAGPFELHATGTRFELSWDPSLEKCEVVSLEGSLELSGPGGSGPIALHTGQHFRGDAKQHSMQVLELEETAALVRTSAGPSPVSNIESGSGK